MEGSSDVGEVMTTLHTGAHITAVGDVARR